MNDARVLRCQKYMYIYTNHATQNRIFAALLSNCVELRTVWVILVAIVHLVSQLVIWYDSSHIY